MRPVKEKGLEEVRTLKRRIGRALGTDSISTEDHDFLRERLDEMEERIQAMQETDSGVEVHIHGKT